VRGLDEGDDEGDGEAVLGLSPRPDTGPITPVTMLFTTLTSLSLTV